jgi:hypothetical protein
MVHHRFMAKRAVVTFLSAGQCGTQWLAWRLRELYRELEVEHEPIGPLYKPRRYFRRYSDVDAILEVPEVRSHLARIERASAPYVETGWPLFAALPLLAARMPDRLRVVHLTRHPVPTALAHLAANSYAGSPRGDAYTRLATLGPSDPNVFQSHYRTSWNQLSPYEKCLFWWTEVNLFGVEFHGHFDTIPFLRVKAEELLAGERQTLERLLEFMGLPWDERWLDHAGQTVDRWHFHADRSVDPLEVHRHPATVEVARQLGYDMTHLNLGALEARYHGRA